MCIYIYIIVLSLFYDFEILVLFDLAYCCLYVVSLSYMCCLRLIFVTSLVLYVLALCYILAFGLILPLMVNCKCKKKH